MTLFKGECPILPHQCGYWGEDGIVEQKSTYCGFLSSPLPKALTDTGSFISPWSYFGTILLVAGGQRGQFPDAPSFRCLYIYPQLLVWNIDSHVFMFTEKPAYQDPLEAPPPSCLLGSAERHSAVNPDLGIQPVSFPYGVL